jgi:CBS domain-containing protein
MKLNQIMTTDVEVIAPTGTVFDAAKKMRDLDIGVLPVCDGKRLVGMITDRDVTIRAIAEAHDPNSMLVRDCMTPELVYCFEDQSEVDAERIMAEKQIRRLPVLTREKELAGIVSLGDIATKSDNVQETGRTLREISEPASVFALP